MRKKIRRQRFKRAKVEGVLCRPGHKDYVLKDKDKWVYKYEGSSNRKYLTAGAQVKTAH